MKPDDAVLYGSAALETVEIIMRDGKVEDRKLRKLLSDKYGERNARRFIDRMVILNVVDTDPIGIRLYYRKLRHL